MKTNIWILCWFGAVLCAGLLVFRDFGIHLDEYHNEDFGRRWGEYVLTALTSGRAPLQRDEIPADTIPSHNLSHGPVLEIALYFAAKVFLGDAAPARSVVFLRDLLNFLVFFAALIVFYRICSGIFQNSAAGLAGSAMLILNPRIFADAFYNTVDIGFLSFFVFSTATMLMFLKNVNVRNTLLHALICALCADVRLVGLLVPGVTGAALALRVVARTSTRSDRLRLCAAAAGFLLLFAVFLILFCPFLWRDTVRHLTLIFQAAQFAHHVTPSPWYYNIVWIGVTTPPLVLCLCCAGVFVCFLEFARRNRAAIPDEVLVSLVFIIVPIAAAFAAGTYLFNAWRHHYFIYPSIVIVSLFGAQRLIRLFAAAPRRQKVITGASSAFAGYYIYILFVLHPFQFSYFNIFVLSNQRLIRPGLDYWRVSQRAALERVLADNSGPVSIYFPTYKGFLNVNILPQQDLDRVILAQNVQDAEYIIMYHYELDFRAPEEFCRTGRIEAGGYTLSDIYRRKLNSAGGSSPSCL